MKTKLTTILILLVLWFCACGRQPSNVNNTSVSTNTPTASPAASESPAEETAQIPTSFTEYIDTKQKQDVASTARSSQAEEKKVGERSEKTVTWPNAWFVGDCTMHGGTRATFRSDGTGQFTARVRSTDDDDTWRMEILLFRADNSFLYRLPPSPPGWIVWYTKKMPHDDTDYDWSINFTYPPEFYNSLASVSLRASC